MSEERCVCCGEIVPEGRQYCPRCGAKAEEKEQTRGDSNE